jgi:hypothetical protein
MDNGNEIKIINEKDINSNNWKQITGIEIYQSENNSDQLKSGFQLAPK